MLVGEVGSRGNESVALLAEGIAVFPWYWLGGGGGGDGKKGGGGRSTRTYVSDEV